MEIVRRSARILGVPDRRRRRRPRSRGARAARRASPTGCCGGCATTPRCGPTATITMEVTDAAMRLLEVDEHGFDEIDRRLLLTIIEKFGGGPVGLDSIAAAISEERDAIEDIYEPFLIQIGFLDRTPRGRVATARAYQHFGLTAPGQEPAPVVNPRDRGTDGGRMAQTPPAVRRTRISGLGTYVPPRLLTNQDLEKMVDTTSDWILQRTGIYERHIVDPGVASSDLGKEAARRGDRPGGAHARRHRPGDRRHDDPRHGLPEHRVPHADEARHSARVGVRPDGGLLGVHVLAGGGEPDGGDRHAPARAGCRHRRHVEHHRLHRSRHVRALRRRRRRRGGEPGGRRGVRHHRLRARDRGQGRHRGALDAGGRQPEARLARDGRPAAALRQAGRAGGVQVRRAGRPSRCHGG